MAITTLSFRPFLLTYRNILFIGQSIFRVYRQTVISINEYPDVKEGVPWPQGDHSIFLQYDVPAIAVSSEWFTESVESQDITHTEKDNIGIVDIDKVIEIAEILNNVIKDI